MNYMRPALPPLLSDGAIGGNPARLGAARNRCKGLDNIVARQHLKLNVDGELVAPVSDVPAVPWWGLRRRRLKSSASSGGTSSIWRTSDNPYRLTVRLRPSRLAARPDQGRLSCPLK